MSTEIEIQPKGGPQTEEGKMVSRFNAQRHGILRETLTEYESINAEEIYNDLSDDLKPIGRVQEFLVESIACGIVKLERISKAEAEVIKKSLKPSWIPLNIDDGYKPVISAKDVENLGLYARYQTSTENRIYRAIALYKQIKDHDQ